jgi:CarD family transcriptional regulator
MTKFKVGDNAVYPKHGVGRVIAVETKEILGTKKEFYSIQIIETGMKIMIPKDNIDSVGLRPIITQNEAKKLVEILSKKDVKIDTQTWNRRHRDYMEKINTGSVYEIAEVLRDLFILQVEKELSYGEKKMLETARTRLFKELELSEAKEELFSQTEVRQIFNLT